MRAEWIRPLSALTILMCLLVALTPGCLPPQPTQTFVSREAPAYQYQYQRQTPAPAPAPQIQAAPPAMQSMLPAIPVERYPVPAQAMPLWQNVAGKTVILDAGHGGQDEGTAHFGLREKDINLDLALRTGALLRSKGVNVLFTRSSDVFIPLEARSQFANRNPKAAFVSIHVNASPNAPDVYGIETFVLSREFGDYERGMTASRRFKANGLDADHGRQALASLTTTCRNRGPALATSLQRSLSGRLGEPDRGVKTADLHVLRETYFCPAVLVEVGFLTNSRTAYRMRTQEWRMRTSDALAEGICEFLRQPE